jgi:hypothetical protein
MIGYKSGGKSAAGHAIYKTLHLLSAKGKADRRCGNATEL